MREKRPQVSIGMPVYNGERFLKDALDSILAQTFQDFELVISDNASTDGTQEICRAYLEKDQRVRYHRCEKNRGAVWNFNHVFRLSMGEYFKWAPHDDVHAPEYVERCVEVLDRIPSVVLCYPRTRIIDEQGIPILDYVDGFDLRSFKAHERFRDFFKSGDLCNAIHGLTRSAVLGETRLMGTYASSDRILVAELALRGRVYEVPEYLFLRRFHPRAAGRANPTVKAYAVWLDPENRAKIQLLFWKWFFEYVFSIHSVRMKAYEKISCYIQMVRWFRWHWRNLLNELLSSARELVRT